MARPSTLPTWATDTNYAAGTDPWSGTATKSEPSAGVKAKGQLPKTGYNAQHYNWLLNTFGEWTEYLLELARGDVFHYLDHFCAKDTLYWSETTSGVGTVAAVPGGGAYGTGLIRTQALGTGETFYTSVVMPPGVRDFRVATRITPTLSTSDKFYFSIGSATAAKTLSFIHSTADSGHWMVKVGAAAEVDSGVVATNAMFLVIERYGGDVYFLIDGVEVHSEAHSQDMTDAYVSFGIQTTAGHNATYLTDYVDIVIENEA